jgi:peptidoglycan/LPS O-acetylase OafA/YrhL
MIYHFSYWMGLNDRLPFLFQRPLNLLGLYAVSTFYCLSGAALFIVYRSRKINFALLSEFAIKRIFRICPLFWVATTASIAFADFTALKTEPIRVMLSYTLLFSWFDPTAYFTTGAWSIGNEWAFYSLFPILLIAWKQPWSRICVIVLSVIASCYYAFFLISPNISVATQFATYIAPLNQVILFVGGMAVGSFIIERPQFHSSLPILLGATLIFFTISYTFDKPQCIHGVLRMAIVGICLAWCYGAGVRCRQSGKIGHILNWVGTLSYSVYLLHPIMFRITSKMVGEVISLTSDFAFKSEFRVLLILTLASVSTMIVSHLSYKLLELPMMRIGQTLSKKIVEQG